MNKFIRFFTTVILSSCILCSCDSNEPKPTTPESPESPESPQTPDSPEQLEKEVPMLNITTQEPLDEIPDKVNYQSASLVMAGGDEYSDFSSEVNIRGRGNTSWEFDKKPYRLKFPKKVSLCNLPKAKSFVLLANWTDHSHMKFAVATKIAQILDMPFTNHVVPVEVTLNGDYKGAYMLTNQPGINSGSVDIPEETSVMWELDKYFDEDRKFRSPILDLPVNLKDPDDMDNATFEYCKADFIAMEKAAVEGKASDLVDMDILARYLLVHDIILNSEMGWPKSVKLYKSKDGKYIFGPIWDFDGAMGVNWTTYESFSTADINNLAWRNRLFQYLEDDPEAMQARIYYWEIVKAHLPEIYDYIDSYAATLRKSAIRNAQRWTNFTDFDTSVTQMKAWLQLRVEALDKLIY